MPDELQEWLPPLRSCAEEPVERAFAGEEEQTIETESAESKGIHLRTIRSPRVGKAGTEKGLRHPQRARIHPEREQFPP
jgi:hypothetical protein